MLKKELKENEYNEFYSRYINLVDDNVELISGYEDGKKMVIDFFNSIPKSKLEYRYAENKWTIKEIIQHIIDTERIFMYRFLCISRNDKTALPSYNQDDYIAPSDPNHKSIDTLIEEFKITRLYSQNLIKSISKNNFNNIGTVSNSLISARACAFLSLGHSICHINIIKERYL